MFGLEMKEYRVLFVCHGNICRSPMGEAILKKMVNDANQGKSNLSTGKEVPERA